MKERMEVVKAIIDGVSERPEVGVGKTMTPTDSAILMLVLSIGARQNLRNDDNIVITAGDVQGYYPLADVDDCVTDLIECGGYVDCIRYEIIDYYEYRSNTIHRCNNGAEIKPLVIISSSIMDCKYVCVILILLCPNSLESV